MKNLLVLFVLTLLTSTVQSQSLTEKEITGTWQVVNVVDAGSQPKQAGEMLAAYFDIYPDHSFQLRTKKTKEASKGYQNKFNNNTWSFDDASQTISAREVNMNIQVSKNDGKMFFKLLESGMTLEVVKPM